MKKMMEYRIQLDKEREERFSGLKRNKSSTPLSESDDR